MSRKYPDYSCLRVIRIHSAISSEQEILGACPQVPLRKLRWLRANQIGVNLVACGWTTALKRLS